MGKKTGIEWTDSSWNPLRGCLTVSEGCRNCYAEKLAGRFSGSGYAYEGLATMIGGRARWTGKVELVEKHLLDPLRWGPVKGGCDCDEVTGRVRMWTNRPRRIFVNSMSDLFHENVPDEWIDRIFAVMALCPQHIFQVLTKRPERMMKYCSDNLPARLIKPMTDAVILRSNRFPKDWGIPPKMPLPNVWLGVSVENQAAADNRIEWLLRTPAALRFISAEPLLGPINLGWVGCECDNPDSWDGVIDALGGFTWTEEWDNADGSERHTRHRQTIPKLDWVIAGGESGPGARPMHPDWLRSLMQQCKAAEVPFFFKQWGEYVPFGHESGGPVAVHHDGKGHYSAAWEGDFDSRPVKVVRVGHTDNANAGIGVRVGKKAAGSLLDGVQWKQFPEV